MEESAPHANGGSVLRVLLIALGVCLVATAASRLLPDSAAATGVGAVFLVATWVLVVQPRDSNVRSWGVSLGGMLEVPPRPLLFTARATVIALVWALAVAFVVFPVFTFGFVHFWNLPHANWRPPPKLLSVVLAQLLAIALPEEAFFRGYLQTALDRGWPPRVRILGANIGLGLLVSSALFALGHVATVSRPERLAVFFPSLLFGWLRARTGGIGASVFFHAMCNLLSDGLARGAGFP